MSVHYTRDIEPKLLAYTKAHGCDAQCVALANALMLFFETVTKNIPRPLLVKALGLLGYTLDLADELGNDAFQEAVLAHSFASLPSSETKH